MGVLVSVGGFYMAYVYVKGIDDGSNPILLALSVLVVGLGVFILLRVGKSDATVGIMKVDVNKAALEKEENGGGGGYKSILDRNNAISEEWTKTVEHRDRLKMLEMAESAKKEPSQQ